MQAPQSATKVDVNARLVVPPTLMTYVTVAATQAAIQAAINGQATGAVICVNPGSFSGAINIPTGKNIVLKGNGIGSTNMTSG